MDAEQILAFRFARSGLASRDAGSLAEAAACPASDFSRDATLLALAARKQDVTRDAFDQATDDADLVLAHVIRGAIHALAPGDLALLGRALIATDDSELGAQLGAQVQRLAKEEGFTPSDALAEVADATKGALAGGRALSRNELHEELRQRVREELMPWCRSCTSHHVAPMLWRYGGVKAGARLDSKRRYLLAKPGRAPAASDAVRLFLHFYAPGTATGFAEWTGLAKPHASRLWAKVEDDLEEVPAGRRRKAYALTEDLADLDSPPSAEGVRLIPPGDPYLQKPNRPALAPGAALSKQLFRPVASPGAVLKDGRLVGLWRVKAKGKRTEMAVEKTGPIAKRDIEPEAERIAELRGAAGLALAVS